MLRIGLKITYDFICRIPTTLRVCANKLAEIIFQRFLCRFYSRKEGFGMNELLGIAATLIIAAFIIIPGLRTFASSVMTKLTSWWNTTIMNSLFPTV